MRAAMFTMPRGLGGHQVLRDLVADYGGAERVSTDFRIGPKLLDKWLSGEVEPPRVAYLALWWQGPMGFSQAYREVHWAHEYMCFLRREARERVELLERLIVLAGYAVPPGAITSSEEVVAIPEDWRPWKTTVPLPAPERLLPALPSPSSGVQGRSPKGGSITRTDSHQREP